MNRDDKQTIKRVLESLKDEPLINSIDPTIIPIIKEDNNKIYKLHPLSGYCTVACLLFLRYSNHPKDFDVYINNTLLFPYPLKCSENYMLCPVNHYFLKNRITTEVIDPTYSQFEGQITRLILYRDARKCFLVYQNGELKSFIPTIPTDYNMTNELREKLEKGGLQLAI